MSSTMVLKVRSCRNEPLTQKLLHFETNQLLLKYTIHIEYIYINQNCDSNCHRCVQYSVINKYHRKKIIKLQHLSYNSSSSHSVNKNKYSCRKSDIKTSASNRRDNIVTAQKKNDIHSFEE